MDNLVFTECFVEPGGDIRVLGTLAGLMPDEDAVTAHFKLDVSTGEWSEFTQDMVYHWVIRLDDPDPRALLVSEEGYVIEATVSEETAGEIVAFQDGPGVYGLFSSLNVVGGRAFVTGMSRQVFRREAPGKWLPIHGNMLQDAGDPNPVGLTAICGTSDQSLLAVGLAGEVWRTRNQGWEQIESPTNVILHDVAKGPTGHAIATGQIGTIIDIEETRISVVDHDMTEDDIWSVEWFRDSFYMSTRDGLFLLRDNEILALDPMDGEEFTSGNLSASSDALVSCGASDILITEDGENWADITPGRE